jgi:transposase
MSRGIIREVRDCSLDARVAGRVKTLSLKCVAGRDSVFLRAHQFVGAGMAHVEGQSRYQVEFVAPALDELIRSDHPIRVIDAFVETLDLRDFGFARVDAEATGRPPYAPGDLLKLHVYGYMNQLRSSRRLEREAARNLEVMWLINRVEPSFKRIADFRKDHADAIVQTCSAFVLFCRKQSLVGGQVAIRRHEDCSGCELQEGDHAEETGQAAGGGGAQDQGASSRDGRSRPAGEGRARRSGRSKRSRASARGLSARRASWPSKASSNGSRARARRG